MHSSLFKQIFIEQSIAIYNPKNFNSDFISTQLIEISSIQLLLIKNTCMTFLAFVYVICLILLHLSITRRQKIIYTNAYKNFCTTASQLFLRNFMYSMVIRQYCTFSVFTVCCFFIQILVLFQHKVRNFSKSKMHRARDLNSLFVRQSPNQKTRYTTEVNSLNERRYTSASRKARTLLYEL